MAYVKLTQPVLADINTHIDCYQNREIEVSVEHKDESKLRPFLSVGLVEAAAWDKYHHLQHQIPDEWCAKADAVDFHINGVPLPGSTREVPVRLGRFSASGGKKFRLPPSFSSYIPTVAVSYNSAYIDGFRAQVDEYAASLAQRIEIREKWQQAKQKVRTYLGGHTSLNAALKAWPGLEMFIPPHLMRKVNEKVTRSTSRSTSRSAPTVPTLDNAEELEALGAIGKIMTSSSN